MAQISKNPPEDEGDPLLLVRPTDIDAWEWGCDVNEVKARADGRMAASLTCFEAGDEVGEKQSAVFAEDRSAGTLVYTDRSGTFLLHRCETPLS